MKKVKKTIYAQVLDVLKKDFRGESVFDMEERIGKNEALKVFKIKRKELKEKVSAGKCPDFFDYSLVKFKRNILDALEKKFEFKFAFGTPPKGVDADLSLPCFNAAKALNTNLVNLSKGVSDILAKRFGGEHGAILRCSSVHGYVNITLKKEKLAKNVLKETEKLRDFYGSSDFGKGSAVMIDYSGPNIAKPMSVGHLRSTIIGNSLKKIYEFSGFTVISINHLGDWGTQFGKLFYALEHWGDEKKIKKDPFHEFLALYVKFHNEAEKNESLNEKAREIFKRLESGNEADLIKKWLSVSDISIRELQKIYEILGVEFDLNLGESFYKNLTDDMINSLIQKGIAVKKENGPIVVEFSDSKLPSFILRKTDDASVYAARDIAAAIFRHNFLTELTQVSRNGKVRGLSREEDNGRKNPVLKNKIIYVVGGEQSLHFSQVFKILEILKIGIPENFAHLSFGMVSLPEGKMSTRAGRIIFLEDLLNEARKKAEILVKEKNPELPAEEIEKIKEVAGIGAVIYADLSQDREKNIVFTWDKMLNLKGDSSPYIQYAYARIQSILKKSEGGLPEKFEIPADLKKEESILVLKISEFPETVKDAMDFNRPDKIANYLNELVQVFSRFYENAPVLSSEMDIKNFRLLLVKATGQVIKNGLGLLGIKVVDKM